MSLKDTFQHSIRIAGNKASVLLYPAVAVALVLRVLLDPAKGGAYLLDAFVDKIAPDLLAGGLGDMVNKIKEKGHFNEDDLLRMQAAVENVFSRHEADLETLLSNDSEYQSMLSEVLSREDLIVQILDSHTDEVVEVLTMLDDKLDLLVPIYETAKQIDEHVKDGLEKLGVQIDELGSVHDRKSRTAISVLELYNQGEDILLHGETPVGEALRNRTPVKRGKLAWIEAVRCYTQAIALGGFGDRSDASLHYGRGIAKIRLGWFDEALSDFMESIDIDPYHVSSMIRIAHLYGSSGDPETALAWYNRAIDCKPTVASLYECRGIILFVLGRHEEAYKDFDIVETMGETSWRRVCDRAIAANDDQKISFPWELNVLEALVMRAIE